MKRFISFMIIVLILAAGIALGYALAKWSAPSANAGNSAGTSRGVATVQTVPIRWGKIAQLVAAYGAVVANPALEKSISVAFESRVLRVYVVKGQKVLPNQPLLQIQASSAELLKLAEAKNRLKIAAAQLRLTKAKRKLQFATRADVIAARQTLATASLQYALMRRLGIGTLRTLRAPRKATVADRPALPGVLEPRGAVLINLLPVNGIQVKLGLLPPNVRQLRLGQNVAISVATPNAKIREPGVISLIAGQVDPVSGLVNVYVTPSKPDGLMIGQYASGQLHIASSVGLLVPHSAVLPHGDEEYLYTVKNSRAVLHQVRKGLFNDREVEVSAPGLHAGEPVVVVGNAELTDGAPVKPLPAASMSSVHSGAINAALTAGTSGKQGN